MLADDSNQATLGAPSDNKVLQVMLMASGSGVGLWKEGDMK